MADLCGEVILAVCDPFLLPIWTGDCFLVVELDGPC